MIKKGFTYAYLQLKRTAKHLPFVLVITLILCLSLSIAIHALVATDSGKEENQKLKIGVVGEFADSYFEFGVSALQALDSSRFAIDILQLSEQEARQMLARRELVGYVLVPEGYIIDAETGEVRQLSYVTNRTGIDMFILFEEEVLKLVSCLVVESQKGVYSMEDVIVDYQVTGKDPVDHIAALSTGYVGVIFNRGNAIRTEVIGISDGLSFGGYMFSGIAVLLFLLCGISFCPVFTRHDLALAKLLRANRYAPVLQIAGEYGAFFCAMLLNGLLLLLGVFFGLGKSVALIPELAEGGLSAYLVLAVKLIPAIFAIAAMQFLLFELVDSVVSGVLLQFLGAMGLAYISGCLYPISFFPETIRAIAFATPPGLARSYFASLLSGAGGGLCFALFLYGLVLLGAAVMLRCRRIRTA